MIYKINRILDLIQYVAFTVAGVCGVAWAVIVLAPLLHH